MQLLQGSHASPALFLGLVRPFRLQAFAVDEDIKQCKAEIIYNAAPSVLIEAALQREKGTFLTDTGALSVRSGAKTGRSPKDKRVVAEPQSENNVWWGPVSPHARSYLKRPPRIGKRGRGFSVQGSLC